MHKPIRELKRSVIRICEHIHGQQLAPGKGMRFTLSFPDTNVHTQTVTGIINIVRNAMSPTFFGANIIFEDYECQLGSGGGVVEFGILLPEVNDKVGIVDQLIRINKVMSFTGNDIDAFTDEFTRYVVKEWNEE